MKTTLRYTSTLLLLIVVYCTNLLAQKEGIDCDVERLKNEQNRRQPVSNPQKPYVTVEQMPVYPGGEGELHKFIAENLKIPAISEEHGICTRSTIRFVVSKTGEIKDIVAVRGCSPEVDKEFIRVIKAMPCWTPGKQGGIPVDVYFTLPLHFDIRSR